MKPTHVDPRLIHALEHASADTAIQAVLTLGSLNGELLSKQEVDDLCAQIVGGAQSRSGSSPHRLKVMYNLQTMVIEARAEFLQVALEHDQITSAMLNAPS